MTSVAYHRNGIGGAPFYVVLFHDGESRKVGLVFDAPYHCAVLGVDLLAQGDIAFASNSWRGDVFEPKLRRIIQNHLSTKQERNPL